MVLADIFHLDDHKTSLKTGIVMDLYYYTLQFAREHKFTKEQTSAFFSIVKKTHEVCTETPFGNLDQTFSYFKELVLCHAVNRPPHSIELFSADQVRLVSEYVVNTYFRHFKMYKYAFTPLVRLDLSINYVGMPPTPPPTEDELLVTMVAKRKAEIHTRSGSVVRNETPRDVNDEDMWDLVDEGEPEVTDEQPELEPEPERVETPQPDESEARKELRGMIQTYLSEEIKKMKLTMDDQLKSTEEILNKKLDIAEGGGKKSGRNSAKGAKKK
ncbi:cilia- and flagella-associated protein 119-like isoform X3 [Dreissena polymorpha]|nr:cilia- and flagella-associated protein 119-like isoform X3 [Dreissena polymorpha]